MRAFWQRMPGWLRRCLKGAGYTLGVLLVMVAVTVGVMEARCRGTPVTGAAPYQSLIDKADRRDEINSYLTYPEWSVVHAYEDLAGVMRAGSESDFGYWRSISGFWSSLCQVKRKAASHGPISFDYNSTLYVVGLSFTAEMGIKGLYETTVGRITAWLQGRNKTPEDVFALAVADDYAAFLRQTPWYEYPFASKLGRFWADTPLWGGNVVRKLERRIALSLEYGSKAIYAKAIGALAGLAPAPLRLKSVVRGLTPAFAAAEPRVKVLKDLGSGQTLIETPRYREFTQIIQGVTAQGGHFVEIAGNANILTTVIASAAATADPSNAKRLFVVPLQARPGFVRIGYDVKVANLTDFIRGLTAAAMVLEHVYDY